MQRRYFVSIDKGWIDTSVAQSFLNAETFLINGILSWRPTRDATTFKSPFRILSKFSSWSTHQKISLLTQKFQNTHGCFSKREDNKVWLWQLSSYSKEAWQNLKLIDSIKFVNIIENMSCFSEKANGQWLTQI